MITSMRYMIGSLLLILLSSVSMRAGTATGAGNYGGVFDPFSSDAANGGMVQLQLDAAGIFTGSVVWQGQRYPMKGKLTDGVAFTKSLGQKKATDTPVTLAVTLILSAQTLTISGELSEDSGGSFPLLVPFSLNGAPPDPILSAQLPSGRRVSFIDPPDPSSDGTTVALAESPVALGGAAATEIPADGFSVVTISKSKRRSSRVVGRLPDAEGTFSTGSPLRGTSYSLFSTLYKKKRHRGGQLFGDATIFDNGSAGIAYQSTMRWGKPAGFDPDFYPASIDRFVFIDAKTYPKLKPGALVPLLPTDSSPIQPFAVEAALEPVHAINAVITFRRGNITVPDGAGGLQRFFRANIAMTPFHTRVTGDNPFHVKIQVDAFRGLFHGTFIHPVLNTKTRFSGAFQAAVLLTPGSGRGNFRPMPGPGVIPLDPLESGGVRITIP